MKSNMAAKMAAGLVYDEPRMKFKRRNKRKLHLFTDIIGEDTVSTHGLAL